MACFRLNVKQIVQRNCSLFISSKRTFLTEAYYVKDAWEQRLQSPLLQKVDSNYMYHALDNRFQRNRTMSLVDADIFVNTIKGTNFVEELLDIIHKLRLCTNTRHTFPSTIYGTVRTLMEFKQYDDLLHALNDRLNYGLFLDRFTANMLLNDFWIKKDYVNGCRTASLLMLQDDFEHPIARNLSLLHCFHYLLEPKEWPSTPVEEEPEDIIKVRVCFIRNPYFDDHFDIIEPLHLVGKTLITATKSSDSSLDRSFNILGWSLYKPERLNDVLNGHKSHESTPYYEEILNLVPPEHKDSVNHLVTESVNVQTMLSNDVKDLVLEYSDTDAAMQCANFLQWEKQRLAALDDQKKQIDREERLAHVAELKTDLTLTEQKLWFFQNEEKIEMYMARNAQAYAEAQAKKMEKIKQLKSEDDDYIPPEVVKRRKT